MMNLAVPSRWTNRAFESLESLTAFALDEQASDVHFSARPEHYHIRCRSHGELHTVAILKPEQGRMMVQRVKAQANMNIAETRSPQDGRLSLSIPTPPHMNPASPSLMEVDVRVATHPSLYGENLVMRLLARQSSLNIEALGFGPETLRRLQTAITRLQADLADGQGGLLLVAGPTGSGKTTTLHAMLRCLQGEQINIMTLEDPVEIELPGAIQTDVSRGIKLDFSNGLRSLLRQDPDIMLIGEIRDQATANLAVQAALTGHLVFASVHAQDSLGCLARLEELGVTCSRILPLLRTLITLRLRRIEHDGHTKQAPSAEIWQASALSLAERYQLRSLDQISHHLLHQTSASVYWPLSHSLGEQHA